MNARQKKQAAPYSLKTSFWPAETSQLVMETTVGGVLREAAGTVPEQVGLIAAWPGVANRRWTYESFLSEAERAARALLERFDPGERIAVWAPNIPEWLFLQYGAALAGLTLVTINPAYRPEELAYVLKQSQSVGIFLVPEYRGNPMTASLESAREGLAMLREVLLFTGWSEFLASGSPALRLPPVSPSDPSQVQYTSGTTGAPKGAILPHRSLTNNARFIAGRLGAHAGDVWINPNPLFHISGSGFCNLGPVQSQATQVLCPFDSALLLRLVEAERAAIASAPPTMLEAILAHPDAHTRDLSSLRVMNTGGMPVPAELVRRAEQEFGVPLLIGYGQTEARGLVAHTAATDAPNDRAESLGRPLSQIDIRIADPLTGATVPPESIGEICVRGYTVMTGYLDMPEASTAAIDGEGWLRTGDLGSIDERGYCRIAGRLKDMIIRGGENIYPREIEEVLEQHPAVAAAAIVGVPDRRYGEQVAACIELVADQSVGELELRALCRAHLAPYKVPRRWVFLNVLPRTPVGKLQKFVLRDMLRSEMLVKEQG